MKNNLNEKVSNLTEEVQKVNFNLELLKELRNYKGKLLLCQPQKQTKTQHYFKLLFLTTNLLFVTSNQIPTYRKLNFLLQAAFI